MLALHIGDKIKNAHCGLEVLVFPTYLKCQTIYFIRKIESNRRSAYVYCIQVWLCVCVCVCVTIRISIARMLVYLCDHCPRWQLSKNVKIILQSQNVTLEIRSKE
jgi:hypothetical protein